MIAPQARYCSVCGSIVHPKVTRWRKVWPHIIWIIQRVVAVYMVLLALRIGLPVALVATPACGSTVAVVGIAPRQLGTIQSLVGLVGGETLLVARPCIPVPNWYVSTPAPVWVVALVARDTTTWQGWFLSMVDSAVATSEQRVMMAIHASVWAVHAFLFDVRTW